MVGETPHDRRAGRVASGRGREVAAPVLAALATLAVSVAASWPALAAPDDGQPLEILALDVSAYPTVAIDVALPRMELPDDVGPGAFTVTGGAVDAVERLDPADLTVALVIDDGPVVARSTVAAHQGSAIELVRNVPDGVEVAVSTTSGIIEGPTADRDTTVRAISRLDTLPVLGTATIGPALVDASIRLEATTDQRRQLVVLTSNGADLTSLEADAITSSLDRSGAMMRVVAVGEAVGPNLERAATDSGGLAATIGADGTADPAAVLRAIDVLTTSLMNQYRLIATMAAPGGQVVRLTVEGRVYETALPDLGPPAGQDPPPTTSAAPVVTTTTTVVGSTTTTTTSPPTTTVTATSVAPTSARPPTVGGGTGSGTDDDDRAPAVVAVSQAIFGLGAIALIVAVIVRQRQRRRRPAHPQPSARRR